MAERGDVIVGEGAIKFGIGYRDPLSDQGGQENRSHCRPVGAEGKRSIVINGQ